MLNLASSSDVRGNIVLRYISACFSVFSEYLLNTTLRVRNAAFSALRIILQQSLKKEQFKETSSDQSMLDLISLDAMSLSEEISNIRKGGAQHISDADKVIIHLRYLLTSRFEES